MPLIPADFENQYAIRRLKNQTRTAEGPVLPPRVHGAFRMPMVTGLEIIKTASYFGGTEFTLSWTESTDYADQISHYNIYVTGVFSNGQPLGPTSARRSPATVRVQTNVASRVIFTVQTVMLSGQVSQFAQSPSVTGESVAPHLVASDVTPGSIPIAGLENGTPGQIISWDAAGVVTVFGPGAAEQLLVGAGAAPPAWNVPQAVNLEKIRSLTAGTYAADDSTVYLCNCAAGDVTINLGAVSAAKRRCYNIKKVDTSGYKVIVNRDGADTIEGSTAMWIPDPAMCITLFPDGTTTWRVV